MEDWKKELKEINDRIQELKMKKEEIKRNNSSWYVGMRSFGNGDYWDEYYRVLGTMTPKEAEDWRDKQFEEKDCYECSVFPVTKEFVNGYYRWRDIQRIIYAFKVRSEYLHDDEVGKRMTDDITFYEKQNERVMRMIDLKYPSYQHYDFK